MRSCTNPCNRLTLSRVNYLFAFCLLTTKSLRFPVISYLFQFKITPILNHIDQLTLNVVANHSAFLILIEVSHPAKSTLKVLFGHSNYIMHAN